MSINEQLIALVQGSVASIRPPEEDSRRC